MEFKISQIQYIAHIQQGGNIRIFLFIYLLLLFFGFRVSDASFPTHILLLTVSICVSSYCYVLYVLIQFASDQIIARKTFNFFQLGLSHKPWGPRWVNFYSREYHAPQVSILGKVYDSLTQEETFHKHEYVGRVLLRFSVDPREEALVTHTNIITAQLTHIVHDNRNR